jgi:hypothetical protein
MVGAIRSIVLFALVLGGAPVADCAEWSGYVSVEPRLFIDAPAFSGQPGRGLSWSGVLAPEFRYTVGGGADRLILAPHARLDEHDSGRSRLDLREASWLHVNGPWALRAGISRVFWGVAESRHLVDIINQTDLADDIGGDAKLGQPMIELERWTEFGSFAAWILPGFRERTFPANDARLRGPVPITSRAEYRSGARDRRTDIALRWSHATGPWDVGLSAFHGTSREPRFIARPRGNGTELIAVPAYDVMTQFGIDLQHTRDAWLWKLEAIMRRGHDHRFGAAVGGFEYVRYSIGGSNADMGFLAEYLYDGRDSTAPPTIQENGLFLGLRLALNDPDATSLLAGLLMDRSRGGSIMALDIERRIGDVWTLAVEGRMLSAIDRDAGYLAGFRKDSFVLVRFARHF